LGGVEGILIRVAPWCFNANVIFGALFLIFELRMGFGASLYKRRLAVHLRELKF
jgi:hypothetical protein